MVKNRIMAFLLAISLVLPAGTICRAEEMVESNVRVEAKTAFEDLSKEKQRTIDASMEACALDGNAAANEINKMKENRTEFEIGVRKVLDQYYSMEKSERGQLESFSASIDDSADEILAHYAEAEAERDAAEQLPFETEKVMLSFAHGTPMETIETVIGNEAVSYEVISDGELHIPEELPDYKKKRLEKVKDIKRDIVILADITLEDTVGRAVDKFQAYDCVKYVSDNTYFESDGSITTSADGKTYTATTNDPRFKEDTLWNMKNVDVPRAWNKFNSVIQPNEIWVAVIDCGVQMNHPDLKNVLLTDYSVDVTQKNKKLIHCAESKQYTSAHGTAVAGVLMAEANNGTLAAGIASVGSVAKHRNPFKIMAIKCDEGSGDRHITKKFLVNAIDYAVENMAEVINISYSAPRSDYGTGFSDLEAEIEFVQDLDIVVVCSAGNDASATVRYPAGFPGVIGVGAIRKDGKLAEYTNESDAVDIVAPGGSNNPDYAQIFSTVPIAIKANGYRANLHGTSYATPLVAGTVAMMLSINYGLSPAQIQTRLLNRSTATAKGRKTSKTFKVLNAGKAVELMKE